MKLSDIRSIGWLNCADGSINLTPCINGSSQPRLINISRQEFNAFGGDLEMMKQKAMKVINSQNFEDSLLLTELEHSEDSYRTIGISNYHLSGADTVVLDDLASDPECNMVLKRDTGWFVKLYESPDANTHASMSLNLNSILSACLSAGYRMIEFDADANLYQKLQTFEV